MSYREEFILGPMFEGLDLNGKVVAELCSGSGQNSIFLKKRFPKIDLTGFDISASACADYRTNVEAPCHVTDLTTQVTVLKTFDVAFAIGGLHHCVSDINATLLNVARLVKPGGLFLMMEPNNRHFLEFARRLWYRLDSSFDYKTERALAHDELAAIARENFDVQWIRYFGGPGYFFILNSMIFRIPLSAKPRLAPALTAVERQWNKLPGRGWHNVFMACWKRVSLP
jgi:SAM-dependent methyltransferase